MLKFGLLASILILFGPAQTQLVPATGKAVLLPRIVSSRAVAQNSTHTPKRAPAAKDVADIPSQPLLAGGDKKKQYFLIGPKPAARSPENGFGLVVILPGGSGSADFHPFVKRIYKHALGDEYLAAQPIAVKWSPKQRIVWPVRANRGKKMLFSTEEFVESVIADVQSRHKLDRKRIFTFSWSSSGPAAYAVSLSKKTSVTGSYVAMSVFKPKQLPPLKNARDHAYFIEHSPDDRVCPFFMAKAAERSLKKNGANVRLNTYQGGHGWRGNVYGRIRNGIGWLEKQTANQVNGNAEKRRQ